MEKFSFFLVFGVTMCLIVHSHSKPNDRLWTLYFKGMCVQVKSSGQIIGTSRMPTLYHLFKETVYGDKVKSTTNNTTAKFTLEAIATGKLVCMNARGHLYTTDTDKILERKRRRRSRRFGRAKIRILPPENCLFKSLEFNSNQTYHRAIGIYSAAHSNATVGRFISFISNGTIRSYRRSFNESNKLGRVQVTLTHVKYFDEILNKTTFGINLSFNKRMRKCIGKEGAILHSDIAPKVRLRHSWGSLKKTIRKCRNRIDRKMGSNRITGDLNNYRQSIKQDSRQKSSKSLIENNPKSIPRPMIIE